MGSLVNCSRAGVVDAALEIEYKPLIDALDVLVGRRIKALVGQVDGLFVQISVGVTSGATRNFHFVFPGVGEPVG